MTAAAKNLMTLVTYKSYKMKTLLPDPALQDSNEVK